MQSARTRQTAFRINELNTQDAGRLSAAGFKIEIDAETTSFKLASSGESHSIRVVQSREFFSIFLSLCDVEVTL